MSDMTDLEKLRQWVLSYPEWEGALYLDHTDAAPGNGGLYPLGLEELSRREDVLGNRQVRCRYRFCLYRVTAGQGDKTGQAQWLLDLQQWIQQQCVTGNAPRFGDVPEQERIRAEKGKLRQVCQTGTGVYEVILTVDLVKYFEGGTENGEDREKVSGTLY